MSPAVLPPPEIPGLTYLKKLGTGGYADVYLYQQALPSRRVAVKVLRDTGGAALGEQFRSEANAMARLEHPNIVPVYATGLTADQRPYLVMMYYPRASLAERVRTDRLTVAEALRIGIQLCSAVETAHRAGLLHRDIKPANVLTSQYGAPGLTDFGIAADIAAAADDDMGVSVPWSPPETLFVTAPPSPRSDVYSLSATLWNLLVGRSPFEVPGGDNSQFALMRRIRDVPAPSTGRADVPQSLDRLLRAGMAKEAAMRPASALELARSLQSIEAELRLPRTEVILPSEGRGEDLSGDVGDATRMRGQRVVAQVEADSEHATRRRMPSLAGDDQADRTRARAVPAPPLPEAEPGAGRRGLLIGLSLVGVLVVGAVGWSLLNGATTVGPRPPESFSTPPPTLEEPLPPGPLKIDAVRTGTGVRFSWTYTNALSTDEFWYTFDEQKKRLVTSDTAVEVKAAPTQKVCIAVKVHRRSGDDASDYTRKCTP